MTTSLRQRLMASTLLFGSATYAVPAFAQATPPAASPDVLQEAAEEQGSIVVTGSRIARPDLRTAAPIAVVGQEEVLLQAGSANVENVLNDLPQVNATQTSTSNNPGGGTATINLRGIGVARTLVLVDGRRYMSFGTNQVVDINTVPGALIERVDIVTGGRSAIYGSDAIAGVVNFIMRRNFAGFEARSSYDITEFGDGQIWDVNGTVGANFDDGRGNVVAHIGYTKRRGIFAGGRDFGRLALTQIGTGAGQTPSIIQAGSPSVPQTRLLFSAAQNAIIAGRFGTAGASGFDFNQNGSLGPYEAETDSYNFAPVNYLQVPQERFLVTTIARYEVDELFQPYIEGQFVNNRVTSELAATPIGNSTPFAGGSLGALRIHVHSPFLSPDVRTVFQQIDAAETGATANDQYITVSSFGYRTVPLGPRQNNDNRNAYRIVAGATGDLGSNWDYDGYYMFARTLNTQRQNGNIAIDKFLFATQTAFQHPTTGAVSATPHAGVAGGGTLVCADATARSRGCVPANIFGLNNISQPAVNYLAIGATNLVEYQTQVASVAFTNPSIFDLGAGGVGVAFGLEWRSENGATTFDEALRSGNVAGFNPGQPTIGGYNVKEAFAEVNIPLLADTFVDLLEVNAAARVSDYSNAPGTVYTYAVGAMFRPVRDITLRGQYSRAIRGPNVGELFLGNTVSFSGLIEGCHTAAAAAAGTLRNICLAQGVPAAVLDDPAQRAALNNPTLINPPTTVGGNPNLREETATTWTVGAVLTPRFLPGFSATVDYFDIEVEDFIGVVSTANIGTACFTNFVQEFCNLIQRNPLGQVERIIGQTRNTGGIFTRGIDFSAGYTHRMGALWGEEDFRLGFSFNGTRTLQYDVAPIPGVAILNECAGRFGRNCGTPTPEWKHTARLTFGGDQARVSGQWRYVGAVEDDNPNVNYSSERFASENYFDLTLSFEPSEHYLLNIGVTNLFNNDPPLAASAQSGGNVEQTNTFPTTYDVIGRAFFISGRLRF